MMLRAPFTATMVASAAALSILLLLPAAEGVDDEMKAACEMWSKLENKTLPLQNEGHANCTTNDECTGFNCKGIYQVGTILHPLLRITENAPTYFRTL